MTIGLDERKFGVDAYNMATKVPKTTFSSVASMLGVEFDQSEIDRLANEKFVMNEFVVDERGLVAWVSFTIKEGDDDTKGQSETTTYFTEDIVSQILGYGKYLADRQAGSPVVDTVLTVPGYFTQE